MLKPKLDNIFNNTIFPVVLYEKRKKFIYDKMSNENIHTMNIIVEEHPKKVKYGSGVEKRTRSSSIKSRSHNMLEMLPGS